MADSSEDMADRVRGAILGGLIGDAMGAATEQLTRSQISQRYGRVASFVSPGDGTFAAGRAAGLITDDSMVSLLIIDKLIATGGNPSSSDAADVVLQWASDESVLRFAGPSTQRAIRRLNDGETPEYAGSPTPTDNDFRASNGAAMKASPSGYAAIGQPKRAVRLATVFAVPTHNSDIGFSGAGAVAAAVATACAGKGLDKVLASSIAGAQMGLERGRDVGNEVPGPSIAMRIELALEIVAGQTKWDPTAETLADVLGAGLPIAEAVPLAIGLVALCEGQPQDAIERAVNLGDDADTVATIAGSIAGAIHGTGGLDPELIQTVVSVNKVDIDRRVAGLLTIQ